MPDIAQAIRWQRSRPRRQSCLGYALKAFKQWAHSSFATLGGAAHLVTVACFVGQSVLLNIFLMKYMSSAVLVTLCAEVPLLIHLVWYWREDSAARAAPVQWLVYSWVHGAKVVVLFCKVMPLLPSATLSEIHMGHFSVSESYLDNFYSPTMLANTLLLTPVFYALLMFRTSKAIFGSLPNRITVDLIMHYDMLWHVVIDMVDTVDMFHYARVAEWCGDDVLTKSPRKLVQIQCAVPFMIFLAIVLHAQSLPGVVVDDWPLHDSSDYSGPAEVPESPKEASEGSSSKWLSWPLVTWSNREMANPMDNTEMASMGDSSTRTAREVPSVIAVERLRSVKQSQKAHILGATTSRQAILDLIQRHTVVIARKRSAIVSIFFVDTPFLCIRVWMWSLSVQAGTPNFPELGAKNVVCFLLNILQFTLVGMASRQGYAEIWHRIARYRWIYQPGQGKASTSPTVEPAPFGGTIQKSPADASMASREVQNLLVTPGAAPSTLTPSAAPSAGIALPIVRQLSPPAAGSDRPLPLASPNSYTMSPWSRSASSSEKGTPKHKAERDQERRRVQKVERDVMKQTHKATNICLHFWVLFVAFGAGMLLAQASQHSAIDEITRRFTAWLEVDDQEGRRRNS